MTIPRDCKDLGLWLDNLYSKLKLMHLKEAHKKKKKIKIPDSKRA